MLGLTCGSFSQTAYNWSQLSERADMAFNKQSEDTAEKKFWRRSLFLYVSESSSGGLSQLRDHHTQVIAALQAPSKRLGYQYQEILSSHRRDERQILLNSSGECSDTRCHLHINRLYADTRNIVHNATCLLLSDGTGRMVWLALIASMIKGNHPRGDEWPQNPEDYIRVPAYLSFLSHGGDMREVSAFHLSLFILSLPHTLPIQTVEMATTAGFYISGAMGLLMRRKFLLRTSLFIGVCSLAANTWLNYYARYFLDAPAYFKDMEMVQWYFESAFIDPSVLLAKGGTKLS